MYIYIVISCYIPIIPSYCITVARLSTNWLSQGPHSPNFGHLTSSLGVIPGNFYVYWGWFKWFMALDIPGPRWIAKLVQVTPITMVYGIYNCSYWGL